MGKKTRLDGPYIAVARRQLDKLRRENNDRPAGDERARTNWILDRIHELIMKASIIEEDGKPIDKQITEIEGFFKVV